MFLVEMMSSGLPAAYIKPRNKSSGKSLPLPPNINAYVLWKGRRFHTHSRIQASRADVLALLLQIQLPPKSKNGGYWMVKQHQDRVWGWLRERRTQAAPYTVLIVTEHLQLQKS